MLDASVIHRTITSCEWNKVEYSCAQSNSHSSIIQYLPLQSHFPPTHTNNLVLRIAWKHLRFALLSNLFFYLWMTSLKKDDCNQMIPVFQISIQRLKTFLICQFWLKKHILIYNSEMLWHTISLTSYILILHTRLTWLCALGKQSFPLI